MTTCPRPHKIKYATKQAANNAAQHRSITAGQPLSTYRCPCGWHHLTRGNGDTLPTPNPQIADKLAALPDDAFEDHVRLEIRGRTTPQEAAALRHPTLTHRWRRTLAHIHQELEAQFVTRRGDKTPAGRNWHQRAVWFQEDLMQRLQEAKELRRATQPDPADPDTLQRIRADRAHVSDLRAQAGEIAIQRLIEAHGIEFSTYLAEECDRLEVEVPARIRKYLPLPAQPHHPANPDRSAAA